MAATAILENLAHSWHWILLRGVFAVLFGIFRIHLARDHSGRARAGLGRLCHRRRCDGSHSRVYDARRGQADVGAHHDCRVSPPV